MSKARKIAVITCYPDPDYVRARTLRRALQTFKDIDVLVLKNKYRGNMRYPEMLLRIIKTRLTKQPEAYLLTFRGYELIPLLQILAWPKPIILDEFINLYEWTVEEHHKVESHTLPARALNRWWSFVLRHCTAIIADTQAHANHSAFLSKVPLSKYTAVPVGTDETVFKPASSISHPKNEFTVFYYGSMLPLHGIDHVLHAAELLKHRPEIIFHLVGGKEAMEEKIRQAQSQGAHVRYQKWIPFTDLPKCMYAAGVCLGGPFGNTVQSQLVVTGKAYQSLACGAPTIIGASKASDSFTDKVNCLLVPQGNSKKIAEAIEWAYEHPKELARIAKNGRVLFEQQFSNDAVVRHLQPVLHQIFQDRD